MSGTDPSILTVVLVAYNSAAVLGGAITSVPDDVRVIVVDNASADNSARVARDHGAEVIDAGENLGFGTACNLGAKAAKTEFVLFLNPDARLLPNALDTLLAKADHTPKTVALGPLILDAQNQPETPRAATLLDDVPAMMPTIPTTPSEVGFLSGACLLVRNEAFTAIGGFDEAIFLYLEDDDLCYRLRKAGGTLMLVPEARVTHDQGTSSPPSTASLQLRNHHTMASHVYLAKKHGLTVDFESMRRKAKRRLLTARLTFDRKRIAINQGRLSGLSAKGPGKASNR